MVRIGRFTVINTKSLRSPTLSDQLVQSKPSLPDQRFAFQSTGPRANPNDGQHSKKPDLIFPPFRSGPLPTLQTLDSREEAFLLRLLIDTRPACSIMRDSPLQECWWRSSLWAADRPRPGPTTFNSILLFGYLNLLPFLFVRFIIVVKERFHFPNVAHTPAALNFFQ